MTKISKKNKLYLLTSLFVLLDFSFAFGGELALDFLDLGKDKQIRYGVQSPDDQTSIKADILYFHGYGDCIENHDPLFQKWNREGFRVISFDYPSHGESRAGSLNWYGFMDLAEMAMLVEATTREDSERPLFLAGWSTGGLLAVRMAQTEVIARLVRRPQGLILFAPGVSVREVVGEFGIKTPFGRITTESLTNNPNPPRLCEIKPTTPMRTPIFAFNLLRNSWRSQEQTLPSDLPTLTLVAGDQLDAYVKSANIRTWVRSQRFKGASTYGFSCPDSKHEMDNEPSPIGNTVRDLSSNFVDMVLSGKAGDIVELENESCQAF